MAEVVLVHGIDQQQKSADRLEADWLPSLAGGVRIAGFPEIADRIWRTGGMPGAIETRMAFYGHLFLTPGQQGDDPGNLTNDEAAFADALAIEWLQHTASRSTKEKSRDTATRELAHVQGRMGREQGFGSGVRSGLKSLAKVSWFAPYGMGFAERFVNRALAQVTRYLTDEKIGSAALDAVMRLIGSDTKVLIGHSLGSVVAFEAAHKLERSLPLLVTIGSPLGLQTIIYQRLHPQPPAFPPQVQRWVNVAERRLHCRRAGPETDVLRRSARRCDVRGWLHRRQRRRAPQRGFLSLEGGGGRAVGLRWEPDSQDAIDLRFS